jgi:hypothetical protein
MSRKGKRTDRKQSSIGLGLGVSGRLTGHWYKGTFRSDENECTYARAHIYTQAHTVYKVRR